MLALWAKVPYAWPKTVSPLLTVKYDKLQCDDDRDHIHRAHVRRYECTLCEASFNLQADLRRHRIGVHAEEGANFICQNPGCATPGKGYSRKDDFQRHVKRRESLAGKGKGHARKAIVMRPPLASKGKAKVDR